MSKKTIKRYLISSLVTFMGGFLPTLAITLKDTSFESLETAGAVGAFLMLGRLVVKASYEGLVVLVAYLAGKFKKA